MKSKMEFIRNQKKINNNKTSKIERKLLIMENKKILKSMRGEKK